MFVELFSAFLTKAQVQGVESVELIVFFLLGDARMDPCNSPYIQCLGLGFRFHIPFLFIPSFLHSLQAISRLC